MSNGQNISFTIQAIDGFSHQMNNVENSVQSMTAELNALGNEMQQLGQQTSASMAQVNQSLNGTANAMNGATNNTQSLMQNLSAASGAIQTVGTSLTIAGAAGAAGLGFAANAAMNFESQLSSIKAVSGATSDEMAKLGDLAEEMGAKTKYSSVEAAQGIEELIKAGVSVTDIIGGGLEGALSLAVAGELELADAAEIASTALNAFKADGLNVAKAADILAGAANASATSVSELKFGLSMVSAVASGVGLSFADTSTALAVFAQNGLKGSDGGTSLKTMLLNLSPSTKEATAEMKRLGLMTAKGTSAFYNADGSIKSLAEISELLKTKLAKLTDEQRQMALKTMFGTDAIRAANILYKEGASGVEKMFGEMSKVKAVDVMNERLNNTKGALEELKGAFETAMISLGTALLPLIKGTAKALQKLVGWFNGLSDRTKKFIAIGGIVATLFALILGPVLLLVAVIPSIVAGFTAIAAVFGVTGAALAGFIGIAALIAVVVTAVGVGLVVAYKKVDWFRNAVDGAFAYLKKTFQTTVEIFKALFNGDWRTAWELAKNHVETSVAAIKKFVGEKFAELKPIVLAKLDEIKQGMADKLSEWKTAIIDWFVEQKTAMKNKLDEWKTAITDWFTAQKEVIVGKLNEWKTAITDWFASMPGAIKAKLAEWGMAIIEWTKGQNEENKRQFDEWKTSITEWFASIPATISEKLTGWKDAIVNWFTTTKENILAKLSEWKTSVTEWFAALPGVISGKLEEWKAAIVTKFTEMKDSIKTKLSEWETSISEWFTSMPSKIRTWFDGWKANMAQKFTETKATIKQKLDEWFATIKSWFTSLPNKPEIKNAGQNMVKKMSDGNNEKKQEFMNKLGKIVVDVALGALALAAVVLVATGREIVKRVIDGIKQIDLRETGKDMIRGMVNGMGSMIGSVIQKAKEIAGAAKRGIEKFLIIKSPSRVMMEIGEFTGQGFVNGMASMVNDIKGVSGEMAGAAVPSNKALGIGASSSAPATSQAINLTLNYNGNGSREDADGMLDMIERGLNDRLGAKLRMNGVR